MIEHETKRPIKGHLKSTQDEFINFIKNKNIKTEGKKILDVGCGSATNLPLFEWVLKMEWKGMDTNPEDRHTTKMDMTDLSEISQEEFDFVFACHSLEHCEDPISALREFKKVLKNGGLLFISLPCYCKQHIDGDYDHLFVFTNLQIKKLLTYLNYKNIKVYKSKEKGYEKIEQYNLIALAKK